MSQSRLDSFVESTTNILVGFSVATLSNLLVLPAFGFSPSVRQSLGISLWFTGISFVRSYVLRRVFNNWSMK